MHARQRGSAYRTKRGWGVRWYEHDGRRRFESGFKSRSQALGYFDEVVKPRLRGIPTPAPEMTFAQLVDRYLDAHAVGREASTIATLRGRLKRAVDTFGDLTLPELEPRALEIADWRTTLPEGSRYGTTQALRQVLAAAVRWKLMAENPAKAAGENPPPRRPEVVPFTLEEVDKVAAELGPYGPLVVFECETGLRPSELLALEWRDVDRGGVLVQRTYARGHLKEYGKTARSRRRVPLSARALDALQRQPRRLNSRLLFPAPGGGYGVKTGEGGYIDLHNFRARDWHPALEAAGLPRRRIYDLRHTFASRALAAGLSIFELARVIGASARLTSSTGTSSAVPKTRCGRSWTRSPRLSRQNGSV